MQAVLPTHSRVQVQHTKPDNNCIILGDFSKYNDSNHFYCHITTCALVSEILESVLQTVQKQFTYRQYILTDCTEDNVQNTHTYTQCTQCTIRHTYSYQYTLYTVCTRSTLFTHIHTIICDSTTIIILLIRLECHYVGHYIKIVAFID